MRDKNNRRYPANVKAEEEAMEVVRRRAERRDKPRIKGSVIRRPRLTDEECYLIYWLFYRITEYLGGDDRPDHGIAQIDTLKEKFQLKFGEPDEIKDMLYKIMGKMWRLR